MSVRSTKDSRLAACERVQSGVEERLREPLRRPHAQRAGALPRDVGAVVAVGAVVKEDHLVEGHARFGLQCREMPASLVGGIYLPRSEQVADLDLAFDGQFSEAAASVRRLSGGGRSGKPRALEASVLLLQASAQNLN